MDRREMHHRPVVDPGGHLLGVVSRRDLLSVFLRPDEEIATEARAALAGVLLADPAAVRAGWARAW